ncbi:MAG: GntR family transcriptional regulator [Pseudomonadota bacterium]
MTATTHVLRQSKMNADAMVQAIKTAVLNGEFVPGQRLVEMDLMAQFDAGRGAVREALKRLAETGLVVIEPNRGARVRRSSRRELIDTFDIRAALEGLCARRAAENVAALGLQERVEAALQQEQIQPLDSHAAIKMNNNESVHAFIVALSGNQLMPSTLANLMMPELRAVFFQGHSENVWKQSRQDHINLLNAILAGEGDEAEAIMRTHVGRTAQLIDSLPPHFLID